MKVTKYVHACLLVETPDRVALFDPGTYSEQAFSVDKLEKLDDIFITHEHPDHFSRDLVKRLAGKFPNARITSTLPVVQELEKAGIAASGRPPAGTVFFESPHESMAPLVPEPPEEIGIHYMDTLTHPGDCHNFKETKAVMALPVTAPWGSSARAVNLVMELRPKYVLPIHDWHWSDEARKLMYGRFEKYFGGQGITFYQLATGMPVDIDA
jgi:L-ascorbate metabolism protein UlaG (beta-lactamase superfamily)